MFKVADPPKKPTFPAEPNRRAKKQIPI